MNGTGLAVETVQAPKGESLGSLGSNAAAKPTTIRMLCSLRTPISGGAQMSGIETCAKRRKAPLPCGHGSVWCLVLSRDRQEAVRREYLATTDQAWRRWYER